MTYTHENNFKVEQLFLKMILCFKGNTFLENNVEIDRNRSRTQIEFGIQKKKIKIVDCRMLMLFFHNRSL